MPAVIDRRYNKAKLNHYRHEGCAECSWHSVITWHIAGDARERANIGLAMSMEQENSYGIL